MILFAWAVIDAALFIGVYSLCVVAARRRYGKPRPPSACEHDQLLDQFMPVYDVADRRQVRVGAAVEPTLAIARDLRLFDLLIVRMLIKARELALGSRGGDTMRTLGLLAAAESLGWQVLGEVAGREIVMGCATRPWEANVVFRRLSPESFTSFQEPGFVKIIWSLRADPIARNESVFRTETRVSTTDHAARERFRIYWSFFFPGIILIRWAALRSLKADAERACASGEFKISR